VAKTKSSADQSSGNEATAKPETTGPAGSSEPRPTSKRKKRSKKHKQEDKSVPPFPKDTPSEDTAETSLPVTEKPVPPRAGITQYVVSVDDATGSILKVEKLDSKTGARRALSSGEFERAASASTGGGSFAAVATTAPDPYGAAALEAYYRGVMDYFKALTGNR
jgi:hypothetical protein